MGFLSVIIVAVGLSLDAMAVALINSACYHTSNYKRLWLMPIFFGFFQSLMPFLGALVGNGLSYLLGDKINFLTFFIFFVLGVKMIYEGFHQGDETCAISTLSYRLAFGVHQYTTTLCASDWTNHFCAGEFGDLFWSKGRTLSW